MHYTTSDTKAGRPKLEILAHETTGIGPLPAEFWRRTLCLGQVRAVVVAAISMYNPNTQLGHIEVRALQTISPSSPNTIDTQALSNLCMRGPPDSDIKPKKKRKKKRALDMGIEPSSTKLLENDPTQAVDDSETKRKKKRKFISVKAVSRVPESAEKYKETDSMDLDTRSPLGALESLPYRSRMETENTSFHRSLVSPTMDGKMTLKPEKEQMVLSSTLNKSISHDHNTSQDDGNAQLRPPQVSPSASTPTNEGTPSPTGTLSSAESNKQYHSCIAKF